ncbi:hypothetical protein HYPSUDRAFT_319386 [Hypholoma sublateritium FD-334 SS-4]|uniref:Uncharacterized protein n=1 Tax=Hypholoma sublateritium (strain FD-334 SS-4) TaxID=945553 RepID=A0A0D2PCU6_HYPSF|nr:hypothetical protein HYPSUDRAFT_319386 [Hypholoma sublateritium FD-334 SS-4]
METCAEKPAAPCGGRGWAAVMRQAYLGGMSTRMSRIKCRASRVCHRLAPGEGSATAGVLYRAAPTRPFTHNAHATVTTPPRGVCPSRRCAQTTVLCSPTRKDQRVHAPRSIRPVLSTQSNSDSPSTAAPRPTGTLHAR